MRVADRSEIAGLFAIAGPGRKSVYAAFELDPLFGPIGPDAIWLDWLGRQQQTHPGHRALQRAEYGGPFELRPDGAIVDAAEQKVAQLSKVGRETWLPRVERQLKLKLIAVVRERADASSRSGEYAEKLEVDEWFTAVWEARWRA